MLISWILATFLMLDPMYFRSKWCPGSQLQKITLSFFQFCKCFIDFFIIPQKFQFLFHGLTKISYTYWKIYGHGAKKHMAMEQKAIGPWSKKALKRKLLYYGQHVTEMNWISEVQCARKYSGTPAMPGGKLAKSEESYSEKYDKI